MATIERVRDAFDRLLRAHPNVATPSDSVVEALFAELTDWSPADLSAVAEALDAERNHDFFSPGHVQRTLPWKECFHERVAQWYCRLLRTAFPPVPFSGPSEVLGTTDPGRIQEAARRLRENGFYVWPSTLDDHLCDGIAKALRNVRFWAKPHGQVMDGFHDRNIYRPVGSTCWVVDPQDILRIPQAQSLGSDPTLLNIVQEYLECPPIHVQANCWWSILRGEPSDSLAAESQLFHQDHDYIRFIKVFVYLNDVTDLNGPHVYIAGSHRDYQHHVPRDYQLGQRLSDEYIASRYPRDRHAVLRGPRGTIVFEDTRGFHKGMPIQCGYRLMLQLQYCCSLFFNGFPSFTLEGLSAPVRQLARSSPRTFLSYDHARYVQGCADREAHLAASRGSPVPRAKRRIGFPLRRWLPRRLRRA